MCLPYQALAGVLYAIGVYDLKKLKSPFFSFVTLIDVQKAAKKFWDKYEKYVFDWARKENRERYSVIISASPDFLVKEIAKRIDIDDFICTVHDKKGKIIGNNCHDAEKVRLFKERYPVAKVINVFSDSIKNDVHIFSLGEKCFNTVKGKRIPFVFEEMYKKSK